MRLSDVCALVLLGVTPALAQEPSGCDKFKWPVERERALLTDAQAPKIANAAEMSVPPATALVLTLVPFKDARLPMPPERQPKSPGSFAGYLRFSGVSRAGTYAVTLSNDGWLDLIQHGHYLRAADFTGARDCAGVRKSVRFAVAAKPLVVQVTGVNAATIGMVISAAR